MCCWWVCGLLPRTGFAYVLLHWFCLCRTQRLQDNPLIQANADLIHRMVTFINKLKQLSNFVYPFVDISSSPPVVVSHRIYKTYIWSPQTKCALLLSFLRRMISLPYRLISSSFWITRRISKSWVLFLTQACWCRAGTGRRRHSCVIRASDILFFRWS